MIRILVDSSADYLQEELKEQNIELVPLTVSFDENVYIEGQNITRNEFYEKLTTGDSFPKTSQPSPQSFVDIFEDVKAKNDEIICILLSSSLSGTYQSATLAKNIVDYDGIHLIDSKSAAAAIRIMVDYAQKLMEEGKSAVEIVEAIEEMKGKVKIYAILDTLENLYRGGRLSKTAATLGEMAKVKPLISISEDGEIAVLGKCIGITRGISQIMKKLNAMEINTDFSIYTVYSYGNENCDKFESKVQNANIPVKQRIQLGAVLGTHIGAEAFGIIIVEK